jgi:hypothetical protein
MSIRSWSHQLHTRDLAAGACLAVVVLAAFLPALSPRNVLFERDIAIWWYPQVECFVRAVAEGTWPVWNPYFSFGLPLWEDPAVQIAYPPTWLNLVLMPATYYTLFALGHSWLGALGLYAFLRAMGIGRAAAFLGGAVWCCSGPFVSAVSLFHHYASSSWMGWVLYAVVRLIDHPCAGNALRLGAIAATLALAGSADVAAMTAVLAAGLLLVRSAVLRGGRVWRALAVSVVFAASIAAAQWLPTLAYVLSAGSRTSLRPDQNMYWSMHPASLIDIFVPQLVAELSPIPAIRDRLFEAREPFLHSLFLGVPAAGLVLLALLGRRDRLVRIYALLFVLLLVLALGRHTPVLPWLLRIPVVAVFRYPVKALFAAALLWGILAGSGLDVWLRDWGRTERRAAGGAAALMGLLAVASAAGAHAFASGKLDFLLARPAADRGAEQALFRLGVAAAGGAVTALLLLWRRAHEGHRQWTAAAVAAVAIADLCAVAQKTNLYGPRELVESRPAVLDHLEPPLEHKRVQFSPMVEQGTVERFAAVAGSDAQWIWARGQLESLAPPTGARWRLAGAFDGDFTGLTPPPLPLMADVLGRAGDLPVGLRVLELGAVDYFVSLMPVLRPGLEHLATIPSVYPAPIQLYRVVSGLPRAYVVGRSRIVPAAKDPLRTLLDPSFDPRAEVVLAEGETLRSGPSFRGSARIVARTFRSVAIDVEASDVGYVVVVETMVPGWRARVDGAPAPVLHANGTFRAVRVPAGAHRIEMDYFPVGVVWGCGITAGALLVAMAWAVARSRRSPPSRPS